METKIFNIEDIKGNNIALNEKQTECIIEHCNAHRIEPYICTVYEDMEDYLDCWCQLLGHSSEEALRVFGERESEFLKLSSGRILRFAR